MRVAVGRCTTLAVTLAVSACGGSTESRHGTAGASNTGGTSADGGSTALGGSATTGGTSASGGSVATGGSAGSLLDCSVPYSRPVGGPRADGPANLGACSTITDEQILARYNDFSARVPKGLYWEPIDLVSVWESP